MPESHVLEYAVRPRVKKHVPWSYLTLIFSTWPGIVYLRLSPSHTTAGTLKGEFLFQLARFLGFFAIAMGIQSLIVFGSRNKLSIFTLMTFLLGCLTLLLSGGLARPLAHG